jgi:hypothetical protein
LNTFAQQRLIVFLSESYIIFMFRSCGILSDKCKIENMVNKQTETRHFSKEGGTTGFGGMLKRREVISNWDNTQEVMTKIVRDKVDIPSLVEDITQIEGIDESRANKITEEGLEALGRMILSLGDNIANFDTFISDEGSGRTPTNILSKIAKRRRQDLGKDSKVRVNYLTAGRVGQAGHDHNSWELSIDRFLKLNQGLGSTLVVTEGVRSADSIRNFIRIFKENKVDVSVAAVGAENIDGLLRGIGDIDIYVGSRGAIGEDMFYGSGKVTGVTKKETGGKRAYPHPLPDPERIMTQVKAERKMTKLIAERMMDLFK